MSHYRLCVVHGYQLSAANKRSIKRACREHGLKHPTLREARKAAKTISALPAVRHVAMERVVGAGFWIKGQAVNV